MSTISTNLPIASDISDAAMRDFFDSYTSVTVSYPADQLDAVVGFFTKRGFDELAAKSTSIVLLLQAKADNINVFTLLDTLVGLSEIQLSAVVAEILNFNRQKCSALGYRKDTEFEPFESRNIIV